MKTVKIELVVVAFLIWIFFTLFYKYWIVWSIFNETSFKMSWVEPRYVSNFKYTPIYKNKQYNIEENSHEWKQYYEKVVSILPSIENLFSWVNLNENIVISINDLWNYSFSMSIKDWKITHFKDVSDNYIPTLVFNIDKVDLDWLVYFMKDWKLDDDEMLKIADIVLNPLIERVYRISRLYRTSNLASFKFDDFMQFEILHDGNILRNSFPIELKTTIVNVDWQWIISDWFKWDPDIRYSLSLNEALEFYKKVVIDLENTKSKTEWIKVAKEIYNLLSEKITYVREDHK